MELVKGRCLICSTNKKIFPEKSSQLFFKLLKKTYSHEEEYKTIQLNEISSTKGVCVLCAHKLKTSCDFISECKAVSRKRKADNQCMLCCKPDKYVFQYTSCEVPSKNLVKEFLKFLNLKKLTDTGVMCLNCFNIINVCNNVSNTLRELKKDETPVKNNSRRNKSSESSSTSASSSNSTASSTSSSPKAKSKRKLSDTSDKDVNLSVRFSKRMKQKKETEDLDNSNIPNKKNSPMKRNTLIKRNTGTKKNIRLRARATNKRDKALRNKLEKQLCHLRTVNMETEETDMHLKYNVIIDRKMMFDISYVKLTKQPEVITISDSETSAEMSSDVDDVVEKPENTKDKGQLNGNAPSLKEKTSIRIKLFPSKKKKNFSKPKPASKKPKKFKCDKCENEFLTSYEYKIHTLEHSDSFSPKVQLTLCKRISDIEAEKCNENELLTNGSPEKRRKSDDINVTNLLESISNFSAPETNSLNNEEDTANDVADNCDDEKIKIDSGSKEETHLDNNIDADPTDKEENSLANSEIEEKITDLDKNSSEGDDQSESEGKPQDENKEKPEQESEATEDMYEAVSEESKEDNIEKNTDPIMETNEENKTNENEDSAVVESTEEKEEEANGTADSEQDIDKSQTELSEKSDVSMEEKLELSLDDEEETSLLESNADLTKSVEEEPSVINDVSEIEQPCAELTESDSKNVEEILTEMVNNLTEESNNISTKQNAVNSPDKSVEENFNSDDCKDGTDKYAAVESILQNLGA